MNCTNTIKVKTCFKTTISPYPKELSRSVECWAVNPTGSLWPAGARAARLLPGGGGYAARSWAGCYCVGEFTDVPGDSCRDHSLCKV